MLDKGNIIQLALIKLGETGLFNDDRDFVYQTAVVLLDSIIKNMASSRDFLFNATMVSLTKTGRTNPLNHIQYNKPNDFMSEIKIIDPNRRDYGTEGISSMMQPVEYFEQPKMISYILGEFYYSNTDEIVLIYCKTMKFTEYPEYMENYLIFALAVALAQAFTTYADKLNEMFALMNQAKGTIHVLEGTKIQELTGGAIDG